MADEKTPAPVKPAAKGYAFKNGAKQVMHPVLGALTVDHLKNEKVIAAIKKLDEKKETQGFFEAMIVSA